VSALLLAAGTAGVVAAAVLFAACLRRSGRVAFLLTAYVLATAEIVVLSFALSIGSWLTRAGLLAAIAAVLVISVAVWSYAGRPAPTGPRRPTCGCPPLLTDRILVGVFALVVLVYAYVLIVALTVPQSVVDTLVYHLPAGGLLEAAARRRLRRELAGRADQRSSAERGDRDHELDDPERRGSLRRARAAPGGLRHRGGHLRHRSPARVRPARCRVRRPRSIRPSRWSSSRPRRPSTTSSSPRCSSCAAYFVAGPATRIELGLFALALAAALGTKVSTLFAVPVLAVFAGGKPAAPSVVQRRDRRRRRVGRGLYWYLVNLAETGKLDGGLAAAFPQGGDGTGRRKPSTCCAGSGRPPRGVRREGQGRFFGPLLDRAGGLRRRPRVRGDRLGAGASSSSRLAPRARAFAVVAAPTIVVWSELGARGIRRAAAAAGIGTAVRRVRGFRTASWSRRCTRRTASHSSCCSFGAGALVVAGVLRETVSRAALAAVAGVPLFLLLFAVPFQYDPQRMRFFALRGGPRGVDVRDRAARSGARVVCGRRDDGDAPRPRRVLRPAAGWSRAACRQP
jgi:hypothetical protein